MNDLNHQQLIHFLKQSASAMTALAKDKTTQEGIANFKLRLDSASAKEFTPVPLPVVSKLSSIANTPYTFNFDEIASHLKWRASPRTDPKAEVIALCAFNEMLKLGDLLAGFMFMSPNKLYPEHQHAPQELYFVISGTASWLYGGNNEYQQLKPGDIAYNHPKDMHGMKTKNESLLALYILWGDKTKGYSY